MTIDRIQAWLNTAKAKAAGAWSGPWEWELDGADRVTLRACGRVPFDLICNDEFRGATEEVEFIAYSRTAFPQAVSALQAVLNLHKPERYAGVDSPWWCFTCSLPSPCVTRQAIAEKLGET